MTNRRCRRGVHSEVFEKRRRERSASSFCSFPGKESFFLLSRPLSGSSRARDERVLRRGHTCISLDGSVTVYGAPKDTRYCQRLVLFGYSTRVVLLFVKTSPFERQRKKWETTRPPTSHSRGLPAMLEMVFASRYVDSQCCFYVNCNIYGYLRVLHCHRYLRYEARLASVHARRLRPYVIVRRLFRSDRIEGVCLSAFPEATFQKTQCTKLELSSETESKRINRSVNN